jgi:hypothetical protein
MPAFLPQRCLGKYLHYLVKELEEAMTESFFNEDYLAKLAKLGAQAGNGHRDAGQAKAIRVCKEAV